jgi:glycolate oxidase iron-sulfur subunit
MENEPSDTLSAAKGSPWDGFEGPTQDQVNYCIRCGLCLSVCPTYKDSLRETESPRGRVALVAKAIEGELDLTKNFKDHMYRCLACLACNDICPVGIKPADLCLEARYAIHQVKPTRPIKPILFRGIFPRTGLLEALTKPVALYDRTGIRRIVNANCATWSACCPTRCLSVARATSSLTSFRPRARAARA